MHEQPVTLVTGANKGIGHEIAKQLAARGHTVWLAARNHALGEAAAKLISGDVRVLTLDVTNSASIASAAERVRKEVGRLDVLVNNAGIARGPKAKDFSIPAFERSGKPSLAALDEVRAIFETNVFGVIAVTQAFLPLLREAPLGRIINISSTLGSLSSITAPDFPNRGVGGVGYGPSKSALNAVTVAFAQELATTRIKVHAVCPGYTATDLNAHSGPRTVGEAAREPVRLALLGADSPTGTLTSDQGPVGW
jgi:NAD(P)-dependent dehydrogenase (short-subunit alcohol dehydrogenase family)